MLSQVNYFLCTREQIFGARLLLSLFYNLPMCASLPNVKRTSASIAYRYQRWLRERDELNNNGSSSQHAIQGRADYPANFDWISSSGRERGREIEEARQREGKRQGGERIGTTGRWSKISFVANKSTAKLVRGCCQCDSTASGSVSFCILYAREWKLPRTTPTTTTTMTKGWETNRIIRDRMWGMFNVRSEKRPRVYAGGSFFPFFLFSFFFLNRRPWILMRATN